MSQKTSREITLFAALVGLLLLPSTAALAETAEPIGRVVSARGAVFAKSPGAERRILQCRDPIYPGDSILTLDDSGVGIDAGSYYVRLGQNSTAEMTALANGAPRVDVLDGHVRLMDSAGTSGLSGELATPGLRLARTGPDQDALVFAEKAGTVSMVCAYDGALDVARRSDPGVSLVVPSGGCVVGKPKEALFAAEASHPQLAVLMRDACEELALVPVSDRFSPDDVGLGPSLAGLGAGAPAPNPNSFGKGPQQPCAGGCARSTGGTPGGGGQPTQFPFGLPSLPTAPSP